MAFPGAIEMFQTEPIIYLQSLGNEWFTFLMILITMMGSSSFLIAITIITTFGVDFKKVLFCTSYCSGQAWLL
ncbi:MAG: hypothetical protein NHB15_04345 [Methanosarcina barkeri]|nr:hypothetical protein [Methanosarcina sp. ERenArc_MAG2]